ncbi:mannosyltransferase putative-domain-containing protein [Tribonema minus]|uniref:Mannosyltransferase putative-domain-containing protein n=1 Tax=Tribonema minus TaxID=303371 RepID=A0A835ZH73_9STRA|nr:mannosyltransferase putative-domain-containing protein [Tribonema minus]
MAFALTLRAYCGALDAYDALAAAAERRPAAAATPAAAAALADAHARMQRAHAVLLPWLRGAWPNPLALRRAYAGRGIAVAAGSRQAAWVYTHVRHLRRLGCALPVEVFYNGAADLDADAVALLAREPGVSVLDLSRLVDAAAAALETWSMKAFTVLLSSFAEVILMDADAIFLRDPTLLFFEPPYARAGALFYRDRLVVPQRHQRAWLEAVLPAPLSPAARASRLYSGAGSHDAESGVAVYNKVKRFKGVLAAALLNSGAAKSYFYEHVYGDKETFWLAHEMVREPYAFAAHPAGILGPRPELRPGGPPGGDERVNAQPRHHACAEQIIHLAEDGAPLWLNAWLVTRDKGALVDALRRGGGGGAAAAAPAWHPLQWWTTEPGDWYMDNGRSYNDGGLTCFAAPAESVPRRLSGDTLAALQRIRDEFMALFPPPPPPR